MDKKYESLFTPMRIGNCDIRNRFILSPMEGTCVIEWTFFTKFNHEVHDFYMERAKNGIGLMIPGTVPVRSLVGSKWLHEYPKTFEPLKPFMDELHSHGAKLFIQLTSGWGRCVILNHYLAKCMDNKLLGTLAHPFFKPEYLMISPDEGAPNVFLPQYKTRAMTREEIHEYVDAYAKCAKLCQDAGVDGVEVHAVHEGYLLDQFTMPYTNHRTDEYGGSFENRYRFAVEVVQAIKAACGQDFPVSLRYSVESKTKGYNDGAVPGETYIEAGRDMAESERAIKYLSDAGYDCFNCDNGTYDAWYWSHPPVYMPLNCNLADVEHIKQFTDKPVFCAGRMQADAAAESIAAGRLDAVTIGRQFLTDGEYITKIKENRMEDIKPCISCHMACMPSATRKGMGCEIMKGTTGSGCALNPRTFKEKKYAVVQAKKPKRFAVIGGGIGGMEFAIQAAMRGNHVTLYEKTHELGGTFIAAAAPSFKEKDRELIEWYRREIKKLPIDVRLGVCISSLDEVKADEIIVCTGGTPIKLRLPGAERAIDAADYLRKGLPVGENVVIIGGGITGCEVAYELVLQGKKPAIVEMQDDLIWALTTPAANSMMLRDLLKFHGVPAYLESTVVKIDADSVTIATPEGMKTIPADTVISSVGYKAGSPLLGGKKKLPHVHVLGDAKEVANLKNAIWGANELVVKLSK